MVFSGVHLKILSEDLFFGEHLRLCPWPRPRAFLSLATIGSVLGRAVLGLGVEPCVLNSTSGHNQRWSRGHKARGQGQGQGHKKNPRPRPRPRTAFPRTDTLEAKDRNGGGQGQGPRTQSASALQKKKKKRSSQKFFRRSPKKKGLHKNFSSNLDEKTLSKKFFNRSTKF